MFTVSLFPHSLRTSFVHIEQDYQLDVQTTKRSFEQSHMVNWIVDSVVKGITPQQVGRHVARSHGGLFQEALVAYVQLE